MYHKGREIDTAIKFQVGNNDHLRMLIATL